MFRNKYLLQSLSLCVLSIFLVEMIAPIAVSYTHLRAHETVLDLVCRLLLEKKKINIITNIISHHS